jgi:ribosomal protein L18
MPKMARPKSRDQLRSRRHFRLRKKVLAARKTASRGVSLAEAIYAQLVDDTTQRTMTGN